MISTDSLFSSPAKLKVLRVLNYQPGPLALRPIASLSGAPLYSVQRALSQLVREKVVRRKRGGMYVRFELDEKSGAVPFLRSFFDLESGVRIAANAGKYDRKAESALQFINQALPLIRGARRWTLRHFSKKR